MRVRRIVTLILACLSLSSTEACSTGSKGGDTGASSPEVASDGSGKEGIRLEENAEARATSDGWRGEEAIARESIPEDTPQSEEEQVAPAECDDGNSIPWDGCTDVKISEFRVNQFVLGHQAAGHLSELSGGIVALAWTSGDWLPDGATQDGSAMGVYGRLFNSATAAMTEEIQLHQQVASYQWSPWVGGTKNGGFAALYLSGEWWKTCAEAPHKLLTRRYDGWGEPQSEEWVLVPNSAGVGSYVVAGHEESEDWLIAGVGGCCEGHLAVPDPSCRLHFGKLTLQSNAVVDLSTWDQLAGSAQGKMSTSEVSGGATLLAFSQQCPAGGREIRAVLLSTGMEFLSPVALIEEEIPNEYSTPEVVCFDLTCFVSWIGTQPGMQRVVMVRSIEVGSFELGSTFVASDVPADLGPHRLVPTTSGHLRVGWTGLAPAQEETNVFVRTIDLSGTVVEETSTVNVFGDGRQVLADMILQQDGRTFLVWNSMEQDGDGSGVYGIILDEAGNPVNWF